MMPGAGKLEAWGDVDIYVGGRRLVVDVYRIPPHVVGEHDQTAVAGGKTIFGYAVEPAGIGSGDARRSPRCPGVYAQPTRWAYPGCRDVFGKLVAGGLSIDSHLGQLGMPPQIEVGMAVATEVDVNVGPHIDALGGNVYGQVYVVAVYDGGVVELGGSVGLAWSRRL